jgi:hypothetical protein
MTNRERRVSEFVIRASLDIRHSSFDIPFQRPDRPHPEHLHSRARTAHAAGDFVKRQSLEVSQDDHFLIIVGQGGDRIGKLKLEFMTDEHFAWRLARSGRLEAGGIRLPTVGRAEPHFAPRLSLRRLAVMSHKIGRVVAEDLPEPAEPFTLCAAAKVCQSTMGIKHRLLDEVRGIDLRLQPASHFRPGDNGQVIPARCEKPVAGGNVALASQVEELRQRYRCSGRHFEILGASALYYAIRYAYLDEHLRSLPPV